MNRYAYRTTGLAIKALSGFVRPNINIHQAEKIPRDSPVIFVINHFTRAETLLLPYHLNRITGRAIWSLANKELFAGGFGAFLEKLGAVSTAAPDRDTLVVKTLLTNEAAWVIFPEGRMVKNKKIFDMVNEKGEFVISSSVGKHPPHTGAATLALRAEFYRNRILKMAEIYPDEARRLLSLYQIDSMDRLARQSTCLVPVNVTYYPIRALENILSNLARKVFENISARALEELMAEGTMLLSGADIDIRFGDPIPVEPYLTTDVIAENINLAARIDFNDSIAAKQMMRSTAVHIMKRYMTAIYTMTTVNHDHLLASLLRYCPGDCVDETDLRARAYMVTTRLGSLSEPVFRHTSLEKSQTHLLTDDRHRKISNFIAIARQTGILRQENGTLVKNHDMFLSPVDFHAARSQNPVVVIANEVEPLTELQQVIREVAVDTPQNIRAAVATHLIRDADFAFEKDYARFFINGESKKKNVGRPFLLRNGNSGLGILLIHGYMAAPLEVRALAQHLHETLGCHVYAPRLRGHGTSPEDLAGRRFLEWIDSVDEGYALLKYSCKTVIAGGFSMGAGLALELASRVDGLAAVFAISPPMRLQDFSTRLVPMVNLWNRLMHRMNRDKNKRDFVDNHPENPHINYLRNPLAAVVEMGKLMDLTASRLTRIEIPALILQSQTDPVVSSKGAMSIFARIPARAKECLLINIPRHGIINGDGTDRVYRAVTDFIGQVLQTAEKPPE
ncbi:MAG: alpha/beta fold hydrolase [Thermodesulfobacteriota bacterium]